MSSRDVSSDFGIGMYPMRKAFAASRYDSYSMALYGALRSTGEAEEEGFKVVESSRHANRLRKSFRRGLVLVFKSTGGKEI